MTQGKTKEDALEMASDWIRNFVSDMDFNAFWTSKKDGLFAIETADSAALLSLMVTRQRTKKGLSLRDMAKQLGVSSRNSVATYERGKVEPTFKKIQDILAAMGLNLEVNVVSNNH
jgi:DNA-binding XRE family transcriptional regulator